MSSLILGGNSFIAQLGNDAKPAQAHRDAIVSSCLDSGIRHFDTAYRPERLAPGASLARLGRQDEAKITVGNFFETFGDGERCAWPIFYRARLTLTKTASKQPVLNEPPSLPPKFLRVCIQSLLSMR